MTSGGRGLFITFEGGEGSGKSSLVRLVGERLGPDIVTLTAEPGRSSIGPALRSLILRPEGAALRAETEALLLAADRAQHVHEVIRPALAAGRVVLCDRYLDSSVAYQGHGRALSPETIADISLWATGALEPDRTFLMDLDPAIGLARRYQSGDVNRLDLEELDFHQAVRHGYRALAMANPDRIVVLDAGRDLGALAEEIHRNIRTLMSERDTAQ